MQLAPTVPDPRGHAVLERLASVVAAPGPAAAERLWSEAARMTTPVVRGVPDDPATCEVTFLWRASGSDVTSVCLNGAPVWHESDEVLDHPAGLVGATRMVPVPGTDVWWRSYLAPSHLRTHYSFQEARGSDTGDRPDLPDPFNPRRWPDAPAAEPPLPEWEEEALGWPYLELPDAPAAAWTGTGPGVARGELTLHRVRSTIRADERRVWVWIPPAGPSGSSDSALPVLVMHDGWHWTLPGSSIATMLDHLISAGTVPRMVVVAQESPSGARDELACDPRFVDFLTEELLPWVRHRWPVTTHPERTAIAGQSLGGLNAVYAAHRRPDVFGAVLSQSGSFWWPDGTPFGTGAGEVMRMYAEQPRPSVRFSLDVGLLEGRMVAVNRHLRDVLVAGGHDVTYREFMGGHTWLTWAAALPESLRAVTRGWSSDVEQWRGL